MILVLKYKLIDKKSKLVRIVYEKKNKRRNIKNLVAKNIVKFIK